MFEFAEALNMSSGSLEQSANLIDAFVLKNQASISVYEANETIGFSFGMREGLDHSGLVDNYQKVPFQPF